MVLKKLYQKSHVWSPKEKGPQVQNILLKGMDMHKEPLPS